MGMVMVIPMAMLMVMAMAIVVVMAMVMVMVMAMMRVTGRILIRSSLSSQSPEFVAVHGQAALSVFG